MIVIFWPVWLGPRFCEKGWDSDTDDFRTEAVKLVRQASPEGGGRSGDSLVWIACAILPKKVRIPAKGKEKWVTIGSISSGRMTSKD